MEKKRGAQVILHNKGERAEATGQLKPGVYKCHDGSLEFLRRDPSLNYVKDGEILITSGVPARGIYVEPSAPICKVQVFDSVVDSDKKNLNKYMSRVIKSVYKELDLL